MKSVAVSSDLPVGDGDGIKAIGIVGKPNLGDYNEVNDREVSSTYFTTLQARLLREADISLRRTMPPGQG